MNNTRKLLDDARHVLETEGYTCVLVNGDTMLTSRERGVKPLLLWLKEGVNLKGYVAADKVVGKAAAFLYVLLGIDALYAGVISAPALAVLERHQITTEFKVQVEAIRNRANTGFCPMETAVWDIEEPQAALAAITDKWNQLNSNVIH